jgi:tetratricopeptide (TPR) repeat protein
MQSRDQEAVAAFQEETRISPQSKLAHEAYAQALEAAGKPDLAKAELKAAAACDPALGAESRILQRYRQGGAPTAAQRTWDEAMREYASGHYPEAAGHLKEWLQSSPENGTAWAMLGLCEFAQRDFDNALIHLDRGAGLGLNGSPESIATAKYTYGILLVHAGDFGRATEILASATTGLPQNSKVTCALGLALLRRPEFPPADSRSTELPCAAGEIANLLQQSKYDDAFPRFQRLLSQYTSTPLLHYAYGTALLALSEFDEAASQMRAEIAISPRSELPLLRLSSIALRQHQPGESIQWAQRALQLAPGSVEAHYLLGRADLEAGNNATALQELEIASRLSPLSPEVHFNLAKAYDRARLPEKAQEERAAFARLNAASEDRRSRQGSQIYSGPHETDEIARPAAAPNASPQTP